jgi:hypothetical protein
MKYELKLKMTGYITIRDSFEYCHIKCFLPYDSIKVKIVYYS